jgi:NTP pyrophosphatase (non-canonical NTP hydrolase)
VYPRPAHARQLVCRHVGRPEADQLVRRHNAKLEDMTELGELQRRMETTYGTRDRARGVPATVAWIAEEVGELARAVRKGSREEQLHELGDALAWLASPANQLDLSLDDAVDRYRDGCPRCGASPCRCPV